MRVALGVFAAVLGLAPFSSEAETLQQFDRPVLRVCADPGNMPLSNSRGEGFQNKIAEVLAKAIGVGLDYFWYTYYERGLVRATLGANKCDVLMDVPEDFEGALVTEPYYKSTFVLAYRTDRHKEIGNIEEPDLKNMRIGVFQTSPVRDALRAHGIQKNTVVDYVFYDSWRNPEKHPGKQVEEVIDGALDAAATWGPIAGYYRKGAPLALTPLNQSETKIQLDYAMALALRRDDADLAHLLEAALEEHKEEIKQLLNDYGVPLVECDNCVISGNIAAQRLERASGGGPQTATAAPFVEHADKGGSAAAVAERLRNGADKQAELMAAVVGGDADRVTFLLNHGAAVNGAAHEGLTPLQQAVRDRDRAMISTLLARGAQIDKADSDGWTPLMRAVWANYPDIADLLIEKGAAVNGFSANGWSPLTAAIAFAGPKLGQKKGEKSVDRSLIERLIAAGADVNAANKAGYTPLMFAAAHDADDVAALLIEKGVSVNAANAAGITPLMIAALRENVRLVQRLVDAGASKEAQDARGRTVLAIAHDKQNKQLLLALSASTDEHASSTP